MELRCVLFRSRVQRKLDNPRKIRSDKGCIHGEASAIALPSPPPPLACAGQSPPPASGPPVRRPGNLGEGGYGSKFPCPFSPLLYATLPDATRTVRRDSESRACYSPFKFFRACSSRCFTLSLSIGEPSKQAS